MTVDKCCCNCCHIKTGTTLVGVTELIVCVYLIVMALRKVGVGPKQFVTDPLQPALLSPGDAMSNSNQTNLLYDKPNVLIFEYFGLFFDILWFISICLLIHGVRVRKHGFLVTYIVAQVIHLILIITHFFLLLIEVLQLHSYYRHVPKEAIGRTSVMLLIFVLDFYFFIVVFRCYKWLKLPLLVSPRGTLDGGRDPSFFVPGKMMRPSTTNGNIGRAAAIDSKRSKPTASNVIKKTNLSEESQTEMSNTTKTEQQRQAEVKPDHKLGTTEEKADIPTKQEEKPRSILPPIKPTAPPYDNTQL